MPLKKRLHQQSLLAAFQKGAGASAPSLVVIVGAAPAVAAVAPSASFTGLPALLQSARLSHETVFIEADGDSAASSSDSSTEDLALVIGSCRAPSDFTQGGRMDVAQVGGAEVGGRRGRDRGTPSSPRTLNEVAARSAAAALSDALAGRRASGRRRPVPLGTSVHLRRRRSAAAAVDEVTREKARVAIADALRTAHCGGLPLAASAFAPAAAAVEAALLATFGEDGKEYRRRARGLCFNLAASASDGSSGSNGLATRVLSGEVQAADLVMMGTEELATGDLRAKRKTERDKYFREDVLLLHGPPKRKSDLTLSRGGGQ
mmetsp:Transcript_98954/g.317296  ORF Transcript_98954/g.317296 Transcript_98954/m.317296 type:complete len:318 (+) Transcript_98954:166-1119(+)|eukprot:CAMPEP_0203853006 /NCGR_PEP_ID=MMETSP0359-20131031/8273_1 /ASSEMBLY_ACC=CAM_ASM_000338 /TAXON_ID=268821 /ORGANISM="Scrippsiella Hangoei, Strain SHTV-5" /LENGTH=317 /DNA_ID=CAMNT_0050769279 /DNA_START=147 /DNA_END=1100 /DNA_ORIENTATION=+